MTGCCFPGKLPRHVRRRIAKLRLNGDEIFAFGWLMSAAADFRVMISIDGTESMILRRTSVRRLAAR